MASFVAVADHVNAHDHVDDGSLGGRRRPSTSFGVVDLMRGVVVIVDQPGAAQIFGLGQT